MKCPGMRDVREPCRRVRYDQDNRTGDPYLKTRGFSEHRRNQNNPRYTCVRVNRSYRTLRDGSGWAPFPGISCLATIRQSLRDRARRGLAEAEARQRSNYSNKLAISSIERPVISGSSLSTVASMISRFFFCRSKIFSSTVPRVISL